MATGTIKHSGLFGKGGMFMSEALFAEEVTTFSANDNLNTAKYTACGKYSSSNVTIGTTLVNAPGGEKLFLMLVYNPHNSETGQLGTSTYRYRIRIAIAFGGRIYIQAVHCEANTTIIYESWNIINTTAV